MQSCLRWSSSFVENVSIFNLDVVCPLLFKLITVWALFEHTHTNTRVSLCVCVCELLLSRHTEYRDSCGERLLRCSPHLWFPSLREPIWTFFSQVKVCLSSRDHSSSLETLKDFLSHSFSGHAADPSFDCSVTMWYTHTASVWLWRPRHRHTLMSLPIFEFYFLFIWKCFSNINNSRTNISVCCRKHKDAGRFLQFLQQLSNIVNREKTEVWEERRWKATPEKNVRSKKKNQKNSI